MLVASVALAADPFVAAAVVAALAALAVEVAAVGSSLTAWLVHAASGPWARGCCGIGQVLRMNGGLAD